MKFNYQARTKKGEVKTGVVKASSKEAALEVLKSHKLYVTALEKAEVPIYAVRLKIFERISKKDVMIFSRQLAIMFKSKVPLSESFQTIAQQVKNNNFRDKILKIAEEVEGGTSLSQALALYPNIFSPFYVNMVKSGETSGKFSEIFNYLADYLEKESHLRSKIRGAMIYPVFVIFVFSAVMAIIISFVIPKLSGFLKQTGQELPLMTKVVIAASEFLRTKWWLVVLVIISLIVAFYMFRRSKFGKKFLDHAVLKIPVINQFLKKFFLTRFALNLSTLISGGLAINRALEITSDVVGNDVYQKVILKTSEEVQKGERISKVLEKHPDIIFPLFFQMVVVGEKTGSLDSSLKNIVEFYQRDIDSATDNFVKMLEPILIIVLGGLVAGLVFAVLMPIYSFTSF